MPKSDRAFRALARAQPDVIAGLLAAVVPGLLPPAAALVPDDVAPTHLDGLPPELDADFATRNRGKRRVRTVALWLTSPPKGHPRNEMTVDDITVRVTTVVLQRVKA